jgi:hypothetical protein
MTKALKKINKKFKLGLNQDQILNYIKFKDIQSKNPRFNEGDKVRIDYEGITSRIDYEKRKPEYCSFIEKSKDKIFTVKYDEKYRNNPWLVSLEEDTTEPRWLFTTSDLILYKEKEKEKN